MAVIPYFKDTVRRISELEQKGIHYLGAGVSGERKDPWKVPVLCRAEAERPGKALRRY